MRLQFLITTVMTIVLTLGFYRGQSQQLSAAVIGSSGDTFTSGDGTLGWTIGEITTETFHQGNFYLTQGFHQPTVIRITGLKSEGLLVAAYPNPFLDRIHLRLPAGSYVVELIDFQGRQIRRDVVVAAEEKVHEIGVGDIPAALYLLCIFETHTSVRYNFKLEKY